MALSLQRNQKTRIIMKKILLLIVCVICLMLGSCSTNPDFKTDGKGNEVFYLEPGVELISADYDAWGGYFNCLVRNVDSTYVPQEKKLIVYGSITGNENFSVTFHER